MWRPWPTRVVFVSLWDWRVTAAKDIGYENWRLSLIINHLKRSVCLTVWNSALCPQIAVVSFYIIISEQRAIFSLYGITWLVFITESECVYCEVRAAPILQFGLLLVYMAVQWLRQDHGDPGSITCQSSEICGAQCGTGTGSPPRVGLLPVSPVITIPSLLRTYFHLHVALTRTNGRNLGTYPKALLFPKSMSIG